MPYRAISLYPVNRGIHQGIPSHRLPPGFSPRQANLRLSDGLISKRPGSVAMLDSWQVTADNTDPAGGDGSASTAAGTITGVFQYLQENGTKDTLVFTGGAASSNRRVYRRGSTRWETIGDGDLTGGVGTDDIFGIATDIWDATVAPNATQTDVFYAANGHADTTKAALIKWTGSGTATGIATGGSGPPGVPKYLSTYANRLIMANVFVSGENRHNRIYWSKFGDAENFTDATAGSAEIIETPDPITRILTLRGRLIIYKEQSIYVADETGISTVPLGFSMVSRNRGAIYGGSVASMGDQHIFVGQDNVYQLDGTTISPIGDAIRNNLRNINSAAANRVFAVVDFATSEYWLFVPEGQDSYAKAAWVYNWREQTWTRWEFPFSMTVGGRAVTSDAPTWDDMTPGGTELPGHPLFDKKWEEVPDDVTWASLLVSGLTVHAVGNSDSTMEEITASTNNDGTAAIHAFWESPDIDLAGVSEVTSPRQQKILSRVDVRCRPTGSAATLECLISTNRGVSYTQSMAKTAPADGGRITFDTWITSDSFRIKLQNRTAGQPIPPFEDVSLHYRLMDSR